MSIADDIKTIIETCCANGVMHVELIDGTLQLKLSFTPVLEATTAPAGLRGPFTLEKELYDKAVRDSQIPEYTIPRTPYKTISQRLAEGEAKQREERQRQPPRMSDIELAMHPPSDLREAMNKPLEVEATPTAPTVAEVTAPVEVPAPLTEDKPNE